MFEKSWKSEPEKVVKVVQVFSTLLIYFSKQNVQHRNNVQLKRGAFDSNLSVQKCPLSLSMIDHRR